MKASVSAIKKDLPLTKKLRVGVVVDYTDSGFSNFAIEYLCENENVPETVLSNLLSKKRQKYGDTVPLSFSFGDH